MLVRKLLGVEADSKSVMRRGLEQSLDLLGSKRDRLAESIDAGRDALFRCRGDQLVDDFADIMCTAVARFSGDGVQREQRRNDPHRLALAELLGDLQQPKLRLRIETVA